VQNIKNRLLRFFPDPETSFPVLILPISSFVYFSVTFADNQNLIPVAFLIKLDLSILDMTKSLQMVYNKIRITKEHTYPFSFCCSFIHIQSVI